MNKLTLVHPFYNDGTRLPFHFDAWKSYDPKVWDKLGIVLVDDGSNPALTTWNAMKRVPNVNLTVYRIKKDLRWNTPGALNLGITQAPTEWVLIMDSDCMLYKADMEKLLEQDLDVNLAYYFPRIRVTDNQSLKAIDGRELTCSILFHKTLFYEINGFDEDFTGEYSEGYGYFDVDFNHKIDARFAKKTGMAAGILPRRLPGRRVFEDIHIHEYMQDKVGPNVQIRTNVGNKWKTNRKLLYAKEAGEVPRGTKLCRFEWDKVLERRYQ